MTTPKWSKKRQGHAL